MINFGFYWTEHATKAIRTERNGWKLYLTSEFLFLYRETRVNFSPFFLSVCVYICWCNFHFQNWNLHSFSSFWVWKYKENLWLASLFLSFSLIILCKINNLFIGACMLKNVNNIIDIWEGLQQCGEFFNTQMCHFNMQ